MSGLVSPRPVSYNSYNPYARNIPPPYADSPINVGPGIPIHTPSQAVGVYAGTSPAIPPVAHEEQKVYGLVIDLLNPEKRESALLELSKKKGAIRRSCLGIMALLRCVLCPYTLRSAEYLPQVLCRHYCKRLSPSTHCSLRRTSRHMPPTGSATHLPCCSASRPTRRLVSFSSMVSQGRCSWKAFLT